MPGRLPAVDEPLPVRGELVESELDQRRRKLMVTDGKLHGLAIVHAAKHCEAIHAVQ